VALQMLHLFLSEVNHRAKSSMKDLPGREMSEVGSGRREVRVGVAAGGDYATGDIMSARAIF
jgi:hypothetical protein